MLCLSKAAASEDAGWDRRGAGVSTEWTALRNSSMLWTIPAGVYSGIQVGRERGLLGTRTGSKSLSESGEAELRDCPVFLIPLSTSLPYSLLNETLLGDA